MTNNQSLIRNEEPEGITLNLNDKASELVKEYLNNIDGTTATKNNYEKALNKFLLYAYDHIDQSPRRQDIIAYKTYLKSKNYRSCTISAYLSVVRSFFNFLQSEKIYPNIAKGIKEKDSGDELIRDCLTIDQAKNLLKHINTFTTPEGLRNKALIMLLMTTGLRVIEAERSNISNIGKKNGENALYIQGKGKGDKYNYVILDDETLKALNDYLDTRQPINKEEPLFISLSDRNQGGRLTTRSLSRIVKETFKQIGIDNEKLTAHSLRHTALTFSLTAGAKVEEVKAMARHSNINTTMRYIHLLNRTKNSPEKLVLQLLK